MARGTFVDYEVRYATQPDEASHWFVLILSRLVAHLNNLASGMAGMEHRVSERPKSERGGLGTMLRVLAEFYNVLIVTETHMIALNKLLRCRARSI
jgi:hypothetical protein